MTAWRGPAGLGAFLAVLALLGAAFSAGAPPGEGPTDVPPLRVATYNVHQWFSTGKTGHHNLLEVRDVLRATGAHVVGLQESEGARVTSGNLDGVGWLARELGMHHAYGPPTSAQIYGVSLLSEWPLEDVEVVDLPNPESIERVAVLATVQAPFGDVRVLVTHFSTGPFEMDRRLQAETVVDLVAAHERAVLLGDFNTEPDPADPPYRVLDGNLTDAWVAAGHPVDTGYTSGAEDPTQRIDHVWLHGTWDAMDAATYGDARASDHLAVAVSLVPR